MEWFPTKTKIVSNKSSHHAAHEDPDEPNGEPRVRPIHHSWVFWVAVVLVLVAMITYVFTLDLAKQPVPRAAQPAANTAP